MKRALKNIFNKRKQKPFKKGRKRKILGSAVLAGNLIFGNLTSNFVKTQNSQSARALNYEKNDLQSTANTRDNSQNLGRIIKTGTGLIFIKSGGNSAPTTSTETTLKISGGDQSKTGPGARAKTDARRHAKTRSSSIFVNGFVPQQTYCRYHRSDPPLSCKLSVKASDDSFQPKDDGNNLPPQEGQERFDPSKYKGGLSPFKEHEYEDPTTVAQNIGFNQPKRLDKSYEKHAKDCFGLKGNRNKENLEIFKADIQDLAQSADEVYMGSYRYI